MVHSECYDEPIINEAKNMITIIPESHLITATAFGEFTLADFQEFEEAALKALAEHQKPNLLFDLREIIGYTIDVAWEEIRFSRKHSADFPKVAVVTKDQWMIWSAWISQLFVESDIEVFENIEHAQAWVNGELIDGI